MYQVLYLGDIWNYIMENFPNEYNLTSKSFAKNNLCKNYTKKKIQQYKYQMARDQICKW